jgi:poly(hydroxyalkanoate) depolymerase family esterase
VNARLTGRIAGLAAAWLLASCAVADPAARDGTAPMDTSTDEARPGEHAGEYRNEAGSRQYRLYVPSRLRDAPHRPPLVVMLHGCTQDAADFARGTRGDAAAERMGAVVLYPEQPASANANQCWNWFDPAHQARGAGEPAILAGMTREVAGRVGADPDRIYVAGLSAGGSMAQILVAAYPELFRALAVHSAPSLRSARDVATALAVLEDGVAEPERLTATVVEAMGERARPVATLVIHGEEDAVVRVVNGHQVHRQWAGLAAALGDLASPPVQLWVVPGLGHAWAGGSADGSWTDPDAPNATARVFEFFLGTVRARR